MNHFLDYGGSRLFYSKSGSGPKSILLFHGFGQNHTAFDSWLVKLKDEYTIYSFDLFFTSQSNWTGSSPLKKEDWKNIMQLFLEREGIEEFDVAGFSMGGKFAFATVESFPRQVKKVLLIAPDGIKINFWYRLATYPFLMRAIFESVVSNPAFFFGLARFLQSIGVINKYLLRFVMLQMDTEEKRKQVYSTWTTFRPLEFDMKTIGRVFSEQRIALKVIVGKFDKVIPAKDMNRLLKYVPEGKLEIIDTGHNNLIDKAADFL